MQKIEIKNLIGDKIPIIFDVGCYDGKDSAELAFYFEKCEIYCFECDPRSIELFKKINGSNNKLCLQEYAIGNHDGWVDFYLSDSDTRRHYDFQKTWSASSSLRKPKGHLNLFLDVEFKHKIKVNGTKLDLWFQRQYFQCAPVIDFIWCDVNGAEKDFIDGAMNVLNNHTRYLYIEFCEKELYEGSLTKQQILYLLPDFELMKIYNFYGNFGNLLLKNKKFNDA